MSLLWLALELATRWWLERPLRAGFYGSIRPDAVREHQRRHGVRAAAGPGWIHLGWIADPERESYLVERRESDGWRGCGSATYGSFLGQTAGPYRVRALPRDGSPARSLGEAQVEPQQGMPPVCAPFIDGPRTGPAPIRSPSGPGRGPRSGPRRPRYRRRSGSASR